MNRTALRLMTLPLLLLSAIAIFSASLAEPAGATDIPLTPFVDCVSYNAQSQIYTAYFGFHNAANATFSFPIGDFNNVYPGSIDQGQPTLFDFGTYPRVFSVTFDNFFIPAVTWSLNAIDVTATANSPKCAAGTTAAASDVSETGATLNGVVTPEGLDTTYSFEYGLSPSLGQTTTLRDAGAGTTSTLVNETVTGLQAGTRYYFRLDATNAYASAPGDVQTFVTPPHLPRPEITTATLPTASFGVPYTATLAATGGVAPYHWSIVKGTLPAGLTFDSSTGTISGVPTTSGVTKLKVQLADAATPRAHRASVKIVLYVASA